MIRSPSEKQIELADKIADILNIDFPKGSYEFTAYIYWKFINSHMQEYIEVMKNSKISDIYDGDIWWGYDLGLWGF